MSKGVNPDRFLTDDHEDGGFLSRVIPERLVTLIRYISTPPEMRYVVGSPSPPTDDLANRQLRNMAFSDVEIEDIKRQCKNFTQAGITIEPVDLGWIVRQYNQTHLSLEELQAALTPKEGDNERRSISASPDGEGGPGVPQPDLHDSNGVF